MSIITITTISTKESYNKDYYLSQSGRREISSRSSTTKTTNFNFVRLIQYLLLVISLTSTCSLAQDINTNTVIAAVGKSEKPTSARIINDKNLEDLKELNIEYVCPNFEVTGLAQLFSIPCKTNNQCNFLGADQRCCKKLCRKGIPAPPKEPQHRAVLGLNRMCPKEPVPEILPVKKCRSDYDCEEERRVCCPDKDLKLYCRTAAPVWSEFPFPRARDLLMSMIGYMQCQMAPPPLLDLFPQPCNRTIECLPNLCCQEGPNKFCRPAKKSVLALAAQATQRFTRG